MSKGQFRCLMRYLFFFRSCKTPSFLTHFCRKAHNTSFHSKHGLPSTVWLMIFHWFAFPSTWYSIFSDTRSKSKEAKMLKRNNFQFLTCSVGSAAVPCDCCKASKLRGASAAPARNICLINRSMADNPTELPVQVHVTQIYLKFSKM